MRFPAGVFRTATFRTSLAASAIFGAATLVLFAFIYWQAASYQEDRLAQYLRHEAAAIAREPASEIERDVSVRFAGDLHRITFAAVFAAGGDRLAGDLAAYPRDLPVDGVPRRALVIRLAGDAAMPERVTVVAIQLLDRRVLVVGRSNVEVAELRAVVGRGLALGLLPALLLALAAGVLASLRAEVRVRAVNAAIERIMRGDLHERLPTRESDATLDQLARSVNRMLDELERLIGEVKGVSDGIAHDLRTPLTRLKSHLEGARRRARTLAELDTAVERALGDLDRAFGIITALLRIGEIESSQRRASFAPVSLNAIVTEAADLYQPIAELRDVALTKEMDTSRTVFADRDLLFEAFANLLDNAIKFTPSGGAVRLVLTAGPKGPILRVTDSGPGIAEAERDAVLRRFYRSGRSLAVNGNGLGLSLVMAILRLHGFGLTMGDAAPGFAVSIICAAGPAS